MLIFFDTEFTDLKPDSKLISIGLVSEAGREFYAELSDTYQVKECGDFCRDLVLPLLEGGDALMPMATLTARLKEWLESFGEHIHLATDSLAWDWKWIQMIFTDLASWPANVDRQPLLLTMNYVQNYDRFCEAIEEAFTNGKRRHHALDDAKANLSAWMSAAY
ncbi:hypothetical protein [Polaromonas sp.]|uniref:hypothetical protein n=1 Tax=Polaromonas sp. TaxID=1869339 RepID=UPI003265ECAC